MRRKIAAIGVLALALGGLQTATADNVFLYQGPPKLEFSEIKFSADDSTVSNLQPSKGSRVYHYVDVTAVTNGDPSTVDRVTLCLYKDSALTDTNTDGDPDELCGYTDGTGTAPANPDPAEVISMSFVGNPSSLSTNRAEWSIDGTNANELISDETDVTSGTTTDYADSKGQTLTLNTVTIRFEFAISHAATNADDWKIRVTTQTTSPGPDEIKGNADDSTLGTVASSFTPPTAGATAIKSTYGMFFFAAFDSNVRGQQNFGDVSENGNSAVTNIATADYWANDAVDIAIIGTDFTHDSGSGVDTIPLIAEAPTDQKAIQVTCGPAGGLQTSVLSPTSFSNGSNILLAAESQTGEASQTAGTHDCTLYYGVGATYANAVYSNVMTLGLLDSDDTDNITGGDYGINGTNSAPTSP